MSILGDAGFKYTPDGGVETTHALGAPMRIEAYTRKKKRWLHEALDYSSVDRVVIGSGVTEVRATFRFDTDPASLLEMLEEGADHGMALAYFPSLADTLTSYDFTLVGVGDEITLVRDRQFPDNYFQMWEVDVVLRTAGDISALITPA